jgi:hypothetical protein
LTIQTLTYKTEINNWWSSTTLLFSHQPFHAEKPQQNALYYPSLARLVTQPDLARIPPARLQDHINQASPQPLSFIGKQMRSWKQIYATGTSTHHRVVVRTWLLQQKGTLTHHRAVVRTYRGTGPLCCRV